MFYAQLNENGVCIAISDLSEGMKTENLKQIESYDASLIGKKYVSCEWEEVPIEPVKPEPTEIEMLTKKLDMLGKIILGGGLK